MMLMIFLHTFVPPSVALQFGPVIVYWYGIFMAVALAAGLLVTLKVAHWHGLAREAVYDLFLYLVIAGFVGARLFYVLYNWGYFLQYPLDVFKIWQGGIAIHGALVFGLLAIFWFVRKGKINFWLLASIIAPGIALGQAIGRWGNYFNQELFGLPTRLPWGIPIALEHRPAGFEQSTYFHQAFLYESIGSLLIFGVLFWWHCIVIKRGRKLSANSYQLIAVSYLLLYSILRFTLEFLRIDPTAGSWFGWRATQAVSAVILTAAAGYLLFLYRRDSIQRILHSKS